MEINCVAVPYDSDADLEIDVELMFGQAFREVESEF